MKRNRNRVADLRPQLPVLNEPIYAQLDQQEPKLLPEPDPRAIVGELVLADRVNHLRSRLCELARKKLHIDPPRDCFNAFLLQLQALNVGSCVIPANFRAIAPEDNAMLQELIYAIPMRLKSDYGVYTDEELEAELKAFESRASDLISIEEKSLPADDVRAQEAFAAYRREIEKFRIDIIPPHKRAEKLPLAKQINFEYVKQRFTSIAIEIINELYDEMDVYAPALDEALTDADFTFNVTDEEQRPLSAESLLQDVTHSSSKMYFIVFRPDPKSENYAPAVEMYSKLTRNEEKLGIQRIYLQKLAHQYRGSSEEFLKAVFLLLRRYITFCGSFFSFGTLKPRIFEGGVYEASLPPRVLEALGKAGYLTELCSSSLNNFNSGYYSAFPDVEAIFGSLGSIFKLEKPNSSGFAFLPSNAQFIEAFISLLKRWQSRCIVFVTEVDGINLESLISQSAEHIFLGPQQYYTVAGTSYLTSVFYEIGLAPLHIFSFSEPFPEGLAEEIKRHLDSPDGLISLAAQEK